MVRLDAVVLTGVCPHCRESVDVTVTKKQMKAIMKGFKMGSPGKAEMLVEASLGRDREGSLKRGGG